MTGPRLVFDHVTKSFRDRTSPRVLRDAIPDALGMLLGRGARERTRFVALDDVSFAVAPGEALGVIGRNGAGKSTTLKLAAGVYRPDDGAVLRDGRVAAMIELSAGFHPDLSGRENVFLSGALLGLRGREVRALLPQILDFAGIGSFVDAPLRVYSTGMIVRLGFAVASFVPAEILLVDEVLAVGDLDFHAKCVERMAERRRANVSVLLVSHHLTLIEQFCDRAVSIEKGRVAMDGPPEAVVDDYRRRMVEAASAPGAASEATVRCGTGEVRITRVEIEGDGGGGVRAGRPFAVRLGLEAAVDVAAPSLGVEIYSMEGVLVARSESRGDPAGRVPAGTASAEVRFDANALLPGGYALTVFARDARGHGDLDVQHRAHRFTVAGEREGGDQGLVTLGARWRR